MSFKVSGVMASLRQGQAECTVYVDRLICSIIKLWVPTYSL